MTDPFPCVVLDDFFAPSLLRACCVEWPDERWPWWHRYCDGTADKYASRGGQLPPACQAVLTQMLSLDVQHLLGVDGAFPDFSLHGAGLHMLPKGGRLGVHLDAERHPVTGWRREASAVLCVSEWRTEWGGGLSLYDGPDKMARTVDYRFNRLILFATRGAYHGVPEPVGATRRTLAAFWWSLAPSDGATRAEFV